MNKKKATSIAGLGLASLMMASAFAVAPVEVTPKGIQTEATVAHATAKYTYFASTSKQAQDRATKYAMENAKYRHSSSINKVGYVGTIGLNDEVHRVNTEGRIYKGSNYTNKTVYSRYFVVRNGYFYYKGGAATGNFTIQSNTGMHEKCNFYVYKGRVVKVNWN